MRGRHGAHPRSNPLAPSRARKTACDLTRSLRRLPARLRRSSFGYAPVCVGITNEILARIALENHRGREVGGPVHQTFTSRNRLDARLPRRVLVVARSFTIPIPGAPARAGSGRRRHVSSDDLLRGTEPVGGPVSTRYAGKDAAFGVDLEGQWHQADAVLVC
jgi:hypothetical protein